MSQEVMNQVDSQQINSGQPVENNQLPLETTPQIDPRLQEARERERLRLSREEKLRHELESTRSEYEKLELSRQALIQNGWDLDALLKTKNNQIVQETHNPVIEELKNQISQLKGDLSAKEQREIKENRKKEVVHFVKENEDKYELIKAHELEDEIIGLIDTHYKKTKKLLSLEEAANKIEEHLEKETEKILSKVKTTKKAKALVEKDFNIADVKVSKNSGTKIETVIDKKKENNDGLDDLREIVKNHHKSRVSKVSKPEEKRTVAARGKSPQDLKFEELMKKHL